MYIHTNNTCRCIYVDMDFHIKYVDLHSENKYDTSQTFGGLLGFGLRKSVNARSTFGRIFVRNSVALIREKGCLLWIVDINKSITVLSRPGRFPFPLRVESCSMSSPKKV